MSNYYLSDIEKCWKIQETLPVKVATVKRHDHKIDIIIPPMKMKYETWQFLDNNHRFQDIAVQYTFYDYNTGTCEFTANSEKDLHLWLEKYSDFITTGDQNQ